MINNETVQVNTLIEIFSGLKRFVNYKQLKVLIRDEFKEFG